MKNRGAIGELIFDKLWSKQAIIPLQGLSGVGGLKLQHWTEFKVTCPLGSIYKLCSKSLEFFTLLYCLGGTFISYSLAECQSNPLPSNGQEIIAYIAR